MLCSNSFELYSRWVPLSCLCLFSKYLLIKRCNYLVHYRRSWLELVLQRLGFIRIKDLSRNCSLKFRRVVMGILPRMECSVSFCYCYKHEEGVVVLVTNSIYSTKNYRAKPSRVKVTRP